MENENWEEVGKDEFWYIKMFFKELGKRGSIVMASRLVAYKAFSIKRFDGVYRNKFFHIGGEKIYIKQLKSIK